MYYRIDAFCTYCLTSLDLLLPLFVLIACHELLSVIDHIYIYGNYESDLYFEYNCHCLVGYCNVIFRMSWIGYWILFPEVDSWAGQGQKCNRISSFILSGRNASNEVMTKLKYNMSELQFTVSSVPF